MRVVSKVRHMGVSRVALCSNFEKRAGAISTAHCVMRVKNRFVENDMGWNGRCDLLVRLERSCSVGGNE